MGSILSCGVIHQGRIGLVETLGQYSKSLEPGCFCIVPCMQTVRYNFNLRQQQLGINVESKTHDNVFCTLKISVFYRYNPEEIQSFAYNVNDFRGMATSIVQDQVRSTLCKITLDEAYETKEELTIEIKESLVKQLGHFGIIFISVIVVDIDPELKVKQAMNEINRQARLRKAIEYEAEAQKIQLIKQAEAEAESKKLSGIGLAEQRRAIVDGLSSSISNFVGHVDNVNPEQVMHLIMMNQYFDTLKDLGLHSKQNSIFIPHNPTSINDLYNQLSEFVKKNPNSTPFIKEIENDDHHNNNDNSTSKVVNIKNKKNKKQQIIVNNEFENNE